MPSPHLHPMPQQRNQLIRDTPRGGSSMPGPSHVGQLLHQTDEVLPDYLAVKYKVREKLLVSALVTEDSGPFRASDSKICG